MSEKEPGRIWVLRSDLEEMLSWAPNRADTVVAAPHAWGHAETAREYIAATEAADRIADLEAERDQLQKDLDVANELLVHYRGQEKR